MYVKGKYLTKTYYRHQALVDSAIRKALKNRDSPPRAGGSLTPQDHFYCQISRVEDIVSALQAAQEDASARDSPKEIVRTAMSVNAVVGAVVRDVLGAREAKAEEFAARPDSAFEMLTWTSDPSPRGLRTALAAQFKRSAESAVPIAEDAETRAKICAQMVDLADVVLDGYRVQLDSLLAGDSRKDAVYKAYEKDRGKMVSALIDAGFVEEAASLAEKYYDFVGLIRICEATGDGARLERYMEQFSEHRFSNFVFDWHVREGKQGKLLAETSKERQAELGSFLRGHDKISWLHDLSAGDYVSASTTLRSLAEQETELVARKRTALSLAKLAALASDEADEHIAEAVEALDKQAAVVTAQEQLPKAVLDEYGFDRETMRVFTPRELIELYVGRDNSAADHVDFKKALDLLEYVDGSGDDEEEDALGSLRLHIWAQAVLRDDWKAMDVDNPLEAIKDTVFFRLAEFCYLQQGNNSDVSDALPALDGLFSSPDLAPGLRNDPNFRFFIRSGYEHMEREAATMK